MAASRYKGKHRARRSRRWVPAVVVTFALGCAVTAATLAIVASDPRWLRGAVIAGLLSAFVPTLLPAVEHKPSHAVDDELRRLRRQLAELRGELDAYLAVRPAVPEQRTTMLTLPLLRAALQEPVPVPNGHGENGHNGHNGNGSVHLIDLTEHREPADR
jgi:hypothetical protein